MNQANASTTASTDTIFEPMAQEILAQSTDGTAAQDTSIEQILSNLVAGMTNGSEQHTALSNAELAEASISSGVMQTLTEVSFTLADLLQLTAVI